MSATFFANTSIISGWQLYKMTSPPITNTITGLSYDTSTGDFTFPSGVFVLFMQITTPGTYGYGFGYQSSATASLPTSTMDPPLDSYIYNADSIGGVASSLNHVYSFTSSNPVRMYFYSAGAATLNQANVTILQL